LVTLTTVASFEIVGSIIVVSLFIVLPASAYLLAKSLSSMILLSSLFGIVATFMGYYIAMYFNGSISGAISISTGAIFAVCFLLQKVKK
jgi:manganese/zinc/iron transport system permease protein